MADNIKSDLEETASGNVNLIHTVHNWRVAKFEFEFIYIL
jgi:hypothetical protein